MTPGDQQQVGVPRRGDEVDAQPLDVVERVEQRRDLPVAAVARAGIEVADVERAAQAPVDRARSARRAGVRTSARRWHGGRRVLIGRPPDRVVDDAAVRSRDRPRARTGRQADGVLGARARAGGAEDAAARRPGASSPASSVMAPVGQAVDAAARRVAARRVQLRQAARGGGSIGAARPGSGGSAARRRSGSEEAVEQVERHASAVRAGVAELEALVDEREVGHEVARHRGDDHAASWRTTPSAGGRRSTVPVRAGTQPDPGRAARALRAGHAVAPAGGRSAMRTRTAPGSRQPETPRAIKRIASWASCARTWKRAATSPAVALDDTDLELARTRRTVVAPQVRHRARGPGRDARSRPASVPDRAGPTPVPCSRGS